ncbi:MAG: cyclic nucleotide-binding domain-containing protein [Candidatus Latescibacterota bacterium]
MNAQQYAMMRVVQKIPVFKGFEMEEVMRLLRISHAATFKPGQRIYALGEPSTEMLVLLKGKLSVVGASGEVLAMIQPGTATGEMGLFTGHPRSANIVAVEQSACLTIRKTELIALLSNNRDAHVKLLYNLINLLAERLALANRLNEQLMRDKQELQEEQAEGPEPQEEEEEYPGDEEEEDEEETPADEPESH